MGRRLLHAVIPQQRAGRCPPPSRVHPAGRHRASLLLPSGEALQREARCVPALPPALTFLASPRAEINYSPEMLSFPGRLNTKEKIMFLQQNVS